MKLGISGGITRAFIQSPLTPLLMIAAFLMGGIALWDLPREEEPQISVPMVDIMVEAPGLRAVDAVELVTEPLEDIVKGIDAVEHVYSRTEDDRVLVTARFFVGTDEDRAILRVHEDVRANLNRIPVGIPEPLIIGRGINDVAIITLTLFPKDATDDRWTDNTLYRLADELQHELIKVKDSGLTYIVGGRPDQIRIEPDPERLSLYGITLNQLVEKVRNANRSFLAGALRETNAEVPVFAGQTLRGVPDVGLLTITSRDGRPVYVKDVANIVVGAEPPDSRAWHLTPTLDGFDRRPAVTIAFAKRQGANAVTVSEELLARLDMVRERLLPEGVEVAVTRNYGETARDKADELLSHLLGATVVIVLIIAVFIGWREGIVVMVVIPATILLTFFSAWLMGFTINRVSLFALIFAIGILVDDAIVVVENIVRHWHMDDDRSIVAAAIDAVAEVGNPTIIATLTVISALLPMMFVSGLMGPYMSPIPANASAAMVFSFFVAVVITPWLLVKLHGLMSRGKKKDGHAAEEENALGRIYRGLARPLVKGRAPSLLFLLIVAVATVASMGLFVSKDVVVKLLPFDNKSELQVVVDLPEGSSLEATERTLMAAADRLVTIPELSNIQLYAGASAPFGFNGLVRQFYLRTRAELGDLQVNLLPKEERDRTSHVVALEVRELLKDLPTPEGTSIKVVEVPPGPPVWATLLAEVYGPDEQSRRSAAMQVREAFSAVDFVVDIDDSYGVPSERFRVEIDQENLEFHGVEEADVYDTIASLIGGVSVGYSHRGQGANPVEIAVRLPNSDLFPSERLWSTPVPSRGGVVELGDVVRLKRERASYPLFRRDGRYAEMVTAELAGQFEAPIYGMLAVEDVLKNRFGDAGPTIGYHGQPADESKITLLWDGEWEVTYTTFRDLGAAFGVALLAIYLLVVGQFSSFRLPIVIMIPIPLTFTGILVGHWLVGAAFTATSMIGFIALAGIMVRNSILLVDFIRARQAEGAPLRVCLLDAGAIRVRPIFLTAITAMVGAAFILLDPIFQGLAVSLLFGLASSTILTLFVIPALYVWRRDDGRGFGEAV